MTRTVYLVLAKVALTINGHGVSLDKNNGMEGFMPVFTREPDAYEWAEQNRNDNGNIPQIIELEQS